MEISSTTLSPDIPTSGQARAGLIDVRPGSDIVTEFESVIVSELLKSMRSTSEEGGMFPGDKSDTYGGMFDMYFGRFIAENGGLGLKGLLDKGLNQFSPGSGLDAKGLSESLIPAPKTQEGK